MGETPGAAPELWQRLAAELDRLDADAGRTLHAALARRTAPLRIQVAGRAGTGRGSVRRSLDTVLGDVVFEDAIVDAPDGPEPVLGGDVVVYVLPTRLDPVSVHPADRAALAGLDAGR
ncbi:hypothetical protein Q8814_24860, partial [Rhodococcus sp. CC-R104]|nr:hypothetical protein [Rhodococcus sp. CC-R104]